MSVSSRRLTYLWALAVGLCVPAAAQWSTPVVDGVIGTGEYGNAQNGTNQIATNSGQTWYMTWDATDLYVARRQREPERRRCASTSARIRMRRTAAPRANNYDGTNFASLPFKAQFVTYFKDGYNEYRTADGNGGWTGPTSNYGTYASSGNGNVRELAIPWSAVTGTGYFLHLCLFRLLNIQRRVCVRPGSERQRRRTTRYQRQCTRSTTA